MIDLSGFKREIMMYGLAVGGIIAVGSLFILGADLRFLTGLAIGPPLHLLIFLFWSTQAKSPVEERKTRPVIVGYGVRLPIYDSVGLILSIQVGMHCMAGCALALFWRPR